jgi:putative hydrolase of the HAD superfamily
MRNFEHIETWVFDLDNTLYNAEQHVFVEFGKKETDLVCQLLEISPEDAQLKKLNFTQKYGSTMLGLQAEHHLAPKDFLDFVHNIDISAIEICRATNNFLATMSGKKIIFTNGPRFFANSIMKNLQIEDYFDALYTIEDAGYKPKPNLNTYINFLEKYKINPKKACMIEDSVSNLKPAYDLGMTTVWLHGNSSINQPIKHDHVHHTTSRLLDWFTNLKQSSKCAP